MEMKHLGFALVLACVGVAAMAGGAVARDRGGHGWHNGGGPGRPSDTPTVCAFGGGAPCCPPGAYCIPFPTPS